MFSDDERTKLQQVIGDHTLKDAGIIQALQADIRRHQLAKNALPMRSVRATTMAIVGTDSGNQSIRFDPFHHQVIRVVDSDGQTLGLTATSTSTNLVALFEADRVAKDNRGNLQPIARLIHDLERATGRRFESYRDICPSMTVDASQPEQSTGWVISYRDLWEWAVLYNYIATANFAQNTMILRDGLLRTKLFANDLFRVIGDMLAEQLLELKNTQKKEIYLVGVAKSSSVMDLYRLVLELEMVLAPNEPRYVRIPREMEVRAYKFPEFSRGRERLVRGTDGLRAKRDATTGVLSTNGVDPALRDAREDSKFVFGSLYLARFGRDEAAPIWAVDLFDDQVREHAMIMGYLFNDACDGFPVPLYPGSLQRAHEAAKLTDFDAIVLNESVMNSVRELVDKTRPGVVERLTLMGDLAARRY